MDEEDEGDSDSDSDDEDEEVDEIDDGEGDWIDDDHDDDDEGGDDDDDGEESEALDFVFDSDAPGEDAILPRGGRDELVAMDGMPTNWNMVPPHDDDEEEDDLGYTMPDDGDGDLDDEESMGSLYEHDDLGHVDIADEAAAFGAPPAQDRFGAEWTWANFPNNGARGGGEQGNGMSALPPTSFLLDGLAAAGADSRDSRRGGILDNSFRTFPSPSGTRRTGGTGPSAGDVSSHPLLTGDGTEDTPTTSAVPRHHRHH